MFRQFRVMCRASFSQLCSLSVFAVLVVVAQGSATSARAQGSELCAAPRAYCASAISESCRAQILTAEGQAAVEVVGACAAQSDAYRQCLREAADCPGVVDQKTPRAPKEESASCASDDCAKPAKKQIVRPAAKDPELMEEQR